MARARSRIADRSSSVNPLDALLADFCAVFFADFFSAMMFADLPTREMK